MRVLVQKKVLAPLLSSSKKKKKKKKKKKNRQVQNVLSQRTRVVCFLCVAAFFLNGVFIRERFHATRRNLDFRVTRTFWIGLDFLSLTDKKERESRTL